MNVTVLGAGSWGTTVASLTTALNPTILWARNAGVAAEINSEHTNATYLPAVTLPRRLRATADLEEALASTHPVRSLVASSQLAYQTAWSRPLP